MTDAPKPQTSTANARLWSERARDWADVQEGLVRKAYAAVLDRAGVAVGTRLLDVGCGAGLAARMAAERGAVVSGFNSFQFAGNPATALAEARRVARPGGTIAIMTWGEPEGMEAVAIIGALRPLLPPPPPGAPGPFALSDEAALRGFATSAGLTPIEILDIDNPFLYPDLETAVRGLDSSGLSARAREVAGDAVVSEAHAKAVAPFRQPDGSYRIGASFRALLARP